MQHVFLDTDVIIDFLTDRKPFSEFAARLFTLAEREYLRLYVSALTLANCYFILKRFSTHTRVISKLSQLAEIVEIREITKKVIIDSLKSDFNDFEDAIQNETAKSDKRINVLLTRNVKDYRKSDLSILSPEQFLKIIPNH
jgi:predicted nucleic acid-binding protein